MNAWAAGGQQVLVGPFQQIPGLASATTAQRPVTQQILPDNLAAHQHMLSDNWRQSFVLDGFDQASLAQLVHRPTSIIHTVSLHMLSLYILNVH